ncbi:MAG: Hsp33 family molecular chaperone HslO, partial [Clostridiales bacterium]|nr:Hsp33 family molecular chaperone HslO [Clostridiales bacterium]
VPDLLPLPHTPAPRLVGLPVAAPSRRHVRGYAQVPDVILPPRNGKLDVGGAVGTGIMNVVKDLGMKEPYAGQTALQTGEIAEDLTYYFASSEQVPSSVGLGVLMNRDNTVKQAGGFVIQLLPFAEDSLIDALERKIAEITSVTDLLEQGHTPESMLAYILGDFGLEITEKIPASFQCNCSRERVRKVLISLGQKDLQEMVDDGKPVEIRCDMCSTAYTFEVDELKSCLDEMTRRNIP